MEIKFAFSGRWHLYQCIYKTFWEVLEASITDLIQMSIRDSHNDHERHL